MIRLALVLLIACAATAQAVDDPIARWTFDASNGADASGHALDLTVQGGVQFVGSTTGKMANLNGSSAYLDHVSSPSFMPGTDGWTVYAWVFATQDTSDYHMIVSWYRCGASPGCNTSDTAGYQLYLDRHGVAQFWIRDDLANEALLPGAASLTFGRWHQLVGTWDPVNGIAKFYVDKVLVGSVSKTLVGLTEGGSPIPLTVGRVFRTGWGAPTGYFHGGVDDVRLYRRPLSAAEISALYTAGTVDAPSPDIAFALSPATPNPSRAASSVRASVAAPGHVRLAVFDAAGRVVRRLFDGPRDAGPLTVSWDGSDDEGARAAPGVYFYRLEAIDLTGKSTRTTRVALIR